MKEYGKKPANIDSAMLFARKCYVFFMGSIS